MIELGTKHFLGRAPLNQQEIRKYNQILATQGLRGFIGAMVNSMEYLQAFNEDTVPFCRFPTLPAANFPNTETLYNQLTKQNSDIVVPSFKPVGSSKPQTMDSGSGSKLDVVAVGRSVNGVSPQPVAMQKVPRIHRISATSGADQVEQGIQAIYQQIMDVYSEEIPQEFRFLDAEAKLLQGEISVREFVRQLASSDAYHARFVMPYPAPKATELLCRHLLGRLPATPEVNQYQHLMLEQGLAATVNALIDGAEYGRYFRENVVPYKRS